MEDGSHEVWHTGNLDPGSIGGGGTAVAISDTPPASPIDGQLWWESDTGILAIRYNDGTSTQWVAVAGTDSIPAAGNDTQFQFNNAGTIAGSPNLIIKPDHYVYVGEDTWNTLGGGLQVYGDLTVCGYGGTKAWGTMIFGDTAGNYGQMFYDGAFMSFYFPLEWMPGATTTPSYNGMMTFEATSNTSVTVKFKGSDSTVRSTAIPLDTTLMTGTKTISTAAPSGGVNGDVWYQVT